MDKCPSCGVMMGCGHKADCPKMGKPQEMEPKRKPMPKGHK